MMVYLKNCKGEQTVRNLPLRTILKLWYLQTTSVPKHERATIRILL